MESRKLKMNVVRWLARLTGLASAAFLLYMVGGHIFGSEPEGAAATPGEMVALAFFPGSTIIGLLLAWKWEGLGGIITVGGMLCFHITMFALHGTVEFYPLIDALALPGLLFITYWLMNRNNTRALRTA